MKSAIDRYLELCATEDATCDAKCSYNSKKPGEFIKKVVGNAEFRKRVKAARSWGNYRTKDGSATKTRVSALTGKPISEELETAINNLLGAKPVANEFIESLPEIRAARLAKKRIAEAFKKRYGVDNPALLDTPSRKATRDRVLADLHGGNRLEYKGFKYEPKREKRLDIVLGVPAAGKSTLIVADLVKKTRGRVCDADDIKERLPEYNGGLGADLLAAEANEMNTSALYAAAARGENIVYPIIGADGEIVACIMVAAYAVGYKTHLYFAKANRNIAKGRLLNRFVGKGRLTELDYFDRAMARSERTFRKLAPKAASATEVLTFEPGI